jgi:hypothetical protein
MTATPPPAHAGAAASLVQLASELADLLERETALVRAMEIARIAPLQSEKSRLTQLFQKALTALDGANGIAALSGAAKMQWLVAGRRLAAAAMENERALRVGRGAVERLVAAIVTAVTQSRRPPTAYSSRRATARRPRVAGIAVDHRL